MNVTSRVAPLLLLTSAVLGGSLVGCSGGGGPPEAEAESEGERPDVPSDAESPCVVGEWQLDVSDYSVQAEAYVLGLGIPIENFAMTGSGAIQFAADGLVATDVDLTTTGTIVAGDTRVPLNQRSAYTASGDWSQADDDAALDLANWSNVPDPDVPVDPAAPPIPAIDYTDIPSVSVECSADTLVLQGPGAPLSALWHR